MTQRSTRSRTNSLGHEPLGHELTEEPGTKELGDESLADQVFAALVKLFWAARQHSQSLQKEYGVTAAQLSALRVLERHGPQSHSQLGAFLLLRGSTVSGMMDRLESRELIHRERSKADRRQVVVTLADAGRELLASIPKGQSKFGKLRSLVAELPEEEARSFLETSNRLLGLMSQEFLLDGKLSTSSEESL